MTEPQSICTSCGRKRNPEKHMYGRGHPVRKAEAWLKRTCLIDGQPCKFVYRAGFQIGGPAVGQQGEEK